MMILFVLVGETSSGATGDEETPAGTGRERTTAAREGKTKVGGT